MAWKSVDDGEIKLQISNSLSYKDYMSLCNLIDCNFSYIDEKDYALLESISSQRVLKEILERKGVTLITLAEKLIEILNLPSKDIKSLLSVITFALSIFNVPTKVGNPMKDINDMLSLSDIRDYMEGRSDKSIHESELYAMQNIKEGIGQE